MRFFICKCPLGREISPRYFQVAHQFVATKYCESCETISLDSLHYFREMRMKIVRVQSTVFPQVEVAPCIFLDQYFWKALFRKLTIFYLLNSR